MFALGSCLAARWFAASRSRRRRRLLRSAPGQVLVRRPPSSPGKQGCPLAMAPVWADIQCNSARHSSCRYCYEKLLKVCAQLLMVVVHVAIECIGEGRLLNHHRTACLGPSSVPGTGPAELTTAACCTAGGRPDEGKVWEQKTRCDDGSPVAVCSSCCILRPALRMLQACPVKPTAGGKTVAGAAPPVFAQ